MLKRTSNIFPVATNEKILRGKINICQNYEKHKKNCAPVYSSRFLFFEPRAPKSYIITIFVPLWKPNNANKYQLYEMLGCGLTVCYNQTYYMMPETWDRVWELQVETQKTLLFAPKNIKTQTLY